MGSFGSAPETWDLKSARSDSLASAIYRGARLWPGCPAVTHHEQGASLTYAQLNDRANQVAHALSAEGISKGAAVALVMENCLDLVEAYFGLAKLGAVALPLNYRLLPSELALMMDYAQAHLVIADPARAEAIHAQGVGLPPRAFVVGETAQVPWPQWRSLVAHHSEADWWAEVDERDTFAFMSTAGTTGLPKLSIKTHGEYTFAALSFLLRLSCFVDVRPGTVMLLNTPVFHGGGFSLLMTALAGGWHTVLLARFAPDKFIEAVQRYRPRITWLVPTMVSACLGAGITARDIAPLQVVISAGAPLPPSLRRQAEEAWPHVVILDVLGQTEACGPIACATDRETVERKPATLGKPLLGVELTVRGIDDDRELGPGEVGEVCYRGPLLAQGYFRNPDATIAAFRGGWFHSGDVGYLDEEGDLYLVDRLNDMMITGGENVFPTEVEDVLITHPAVAEACVFGLPDPTWGDLVAAAVVLTADATASEADIIAHCRARLAHYKCPRRVFFIDSLPKSSVGKVLRRQARERVLAEMDSK